MPYLCVIVLEKSSQNGTHTNTHIHSYLHPEQSTLYNLVSFNVSYKNEKKSA